MTCTGWLFVTVVLIFAFGGKIQINENQILWTEDRIRKNEGEIYINFHNKTVNTRKMQIKTMQSGIEKNIQQ